MGSNENRTDFDTYRQYGLELVRAVDDSIGPWLFGVVGERCGGSVPAGIADAVEAAIEQVRAAAHEALTELALGDVDAPLSGPLERLRRTMSPITATLTAADVPPPARDPIDVEMRPNDTYGIGPHSFMDLGQRVHDAGITWGAAKAYLHAQRRRS